MIRNLLMAISQLRSATAARLACNARTVTNLPSLGVDEAEVILHSRTLHPGNIHAAAFDRNFYGVRAKLKRGRIQFPEIGSDPYFSHSSIEISSTSKIKVAFGGISAPGFPSGP